MVLYLFVRNGEDIVFASKSMSDFAALDHSAPRGNKKRRPASSGGGPKPSSRRKSGGLERNGWKVGFVFKATAAHAICLEEMVKTGMAKCWGRMVLQTWVKTRPWGSL